MERDVERELSQRMASIESTIVGFAKDTTRRLERIEEQTTKTNGRVDALEKVNAVRDALEMSGSKAVPVVAPAVITLTDIKWWVAIAATCFSAGAAFAKLVGWM